MSGLSGGDRLVYGEFTRPAAAAAVGPRNAKFEKYFGTKKRK
jgi:hypothetical protein